MRSDLFIHRENIFRTSTKEEITLYACDLSAKIIELSEAYGISEQGIINMLVVAIKLGVGGDGIINYHEEELIKAVCQDLFDGNYEPVLAFVRGKISDIEFNVVNNVVMLKELAVEFLDFVLCFAYIDGVFEDEIADRLDKIFMTTLLYKYADDVSNEFLTVGTADELDDLEKKIMQWIKVKGKSRSLREIQAHFNMVSPKEIKSALDALCEKGFLYGGSTGNSIMEEASEEERLQLSAKKIVGDMEIYSLYPCEFNAFRLITKEKVYILYAGIIEENLDIGMAPDDYLPEIKNHKLIWGDYRIYTVSELMASLYFVLSDKLDYDLLKTMFDLEANYIDADKAVCSWLVCSHKDNAFFSKEEVETLKRMSQSFVPRDKRDEILDFMYSCFSTHDHIFEKVISNFLGIIAEVKELKEILRIDICEGIIGMDTLGDEEMCTTHCLDFQKLI